MSLAAATTHHASQSSRPLILKRTAAASGRRAISSNAFRLRVLAAVIVLTFSSGLAHSARADTTVSDTTFGNGGVASSATFPGTLAAVSRGMVVQPDGKIVVVGGLLISQVPLPIPDSIARTAETNLFPSRLDNYDFGVARYNPDGTLDTTFGTVLNFPSMEIRSGTVRTDFGGFDEAFGAAIQPDGKIVVVGTTGILSHYESIAMIRYNADGSVDESFGIGGKVTDPMRNVRAMSCVLIEPDGRIVVAGHGVARFFSDGSLDIIFSVADAIPLPERKITVGAMARLSDGKIVVAGNSRVSLAHDALNTSIAIARYNPDGTFDTGFGSYGKTFTDFSSVVGGGDPSSSPFDGATALAIQPDGKIVVGGTVTTKFIPPMMGAGGWLTPYYYNSVFALLRYHSNGTLDPGFGTGGATLTDFDNPFPVEPEGMFSYQGSVINSVQLQRDGKILALGNACLPPSDGHSSCKGGAAMVRYNTDGLVDQSFGEGGSAIFKGVPGFSDAALLRNGKIITTDHNFSARRYMFVSDIFQEALTKYVPILRYDSQENYFPVAVEAITDNPGNKLVRDLRPFSEHLLARNPAHGKTPLLDINFLGALYPNELAAHEADKISEKHGYAKDASRFQSDAAYANRIYGRVAHGKNAAGQNVAWLQYWFFYYYNDFNIAGVGFDLHEGDWEMIQIALDANAHPISAVYSQHEGASRCGWTDSRMEKGGINFDRPVVYVARGSHASYFKPGRHNLHNLPVFDVINNPIHGAEPTVVPITDASPGWMNWPGRWGGTRKRADWILFDGNSPRGPKFQSGDKWKDPQAFAAAAASDCK